MQIIEEEPNEKASEIHIVERKGNKSRQPNDTIQQVPNNLDSSVAKHKKSMQRDAPQEKCIKDINREKVPQKEPIIKKIEVAENSMIQPRAKKAKTMEELAKEKLLADQPSIKEEFKRSEKES